MERIRHEYAINRKKNTQGNETQRFESDGLPFGNFLWNIYLRLFSFFVYSDYFVAI